METFQNVWFVCCKRGPSQREMSSARAGPIPPVGSSGETAVSRSFAGPEKALEKVEPDLWGKL